MIGLTKKQTILLTIASFFVGATLGYLIAPKSAKVTINGNNNTVKTAYRTNNGNGNGCNNQSKSKK